MNISLKRIQAIFMKDFKEFSRNYAISVVTLFPLVMAFIFSQNPASATIQNYFMTINMTFSIVTAYVQACLIAEEKERNTLRNLMMSPASIVDILLGKSSLVFVVTAIILGLTVFILGYEPKQLLLMLVAFVLSTLFYLALGTICGLFSKSVMEASVAVLPILIIFSMAPMLTMLGEDHIAYQIAQWLPSTQLVFLAELAEQGAAMSELVEPLAIIAIWTVVATAVSLVLFKKRMKDE